MKQSKKKCTKSTAQTQTTTLKNRKSLTKQSLLRSPIYPSTPIRDNLSKTYFSNPELNNENKVERPPQSKTNYASLSSGWERLKSSNLLNQTTDISITKIDTKNRFSFIEGMETEEPSTENK